MGFLDKLLGRKKAETADKPMSESPPPAQKAAEPAAPAAEPKAAEEPKKK